MKKLVIFLSALFLVFFISISPTSAQTCTGTYTSSNVWGCQSNGFGGEMCVMTSESSSCIYNSSAGQCNAPILAAESCIDTGGSCVKQNRFDGFTTTGCTTVVPPPPPTCNNNGTCDSGENNSNCPGDCPASAPTTPPGWGACGGCTANSCQTQYSRTDAGGNCVCDPTGCGYAPPTPSDPRCVVQNNIGPTTFYAGQTGQVVSNVNYYDGGTYSSHNFTSSDQTVLQLVAGQNANGARTVLRKNVAALVPGTSIFRTNVALSNGSPPSCSRGRTITVLPVPSWWQVTGGGDVIVEGDITSNIPESCTTDETAGGTCRDEFIVEDTDSLKPGAVIYQGPATALDFRLTTSSGGNANIGGLAGPSWTSNAAYTPVLYNYDYFEALSSGKTFVNTSGSINTGTINGATADADGYVWIKNVGDLQISSPINLAGTKAIIFVQDGDLIIDSEIRLNNTATGFVMFVVGDDGTGTKGNIIIDPSVGNNSLSATTPNITGVFWADGQISTGTDGPQSDTRKLIMYGSFAALRGFNLQRSLSSTDNQTSPAEVFQYGPEFQLNFPQTLSSKRLIWREVAP